MREFVPGKPIKRTPPVSGWVFCRCRNRVWSHPWRVSRICNWGRDQRRIYLALAIAPFVRRRWPQVLVTWTRLLHSILPPGAPATAILHWQNSQPLFSMLSAHRSAAVRSLLPPDKRDFCSENFKKTRGLKCPTHGRCLQMASGVLARRTGAAGAGACPVKAGVFSGGKTHRGNSQEPRSTS
jgi:hypothetical protein